MTSTKSIILFAATLLLGAGAAYLWTGQQTAQQSPIATPGLSLAALAGKPVFDQKCAECHGDQGKGSDKGPPLIHRIYNPGHHADLSFFLAVRKGVRSHHWNFGDMPPQPEVTEEQVAAILRYIREEQVANGIGLEPHKM